MLAYQISPIKGSEYAVGWNFLINLAKNNKVFLLYGASGLHMGDQSELIEYFDKNPNVNIKIYPVKPNLCTKFLNFFNKKRILKFTFYLAFQCWQLSALHVAKKIIEKNDIDIIHQLNPIGFREPGYLWKINKPFIWGPVGASMLVDLKLLTKSSLKNKIYFRFKNFVTTFQLKYGRRIHMAAKKSSCIIFCNSQSQENFQKHVGVSGIVIPEQGTFKFPQYSLIPTDYPNDILNIVWAGVIESRKNLEFLFYALSLVAHKSKWSLNIVGEGIMRSELECIAKKLLISKNIYWLGHKTREDVFKIIQKSDIMALSSLSEGNPAVLFESISLGVPIISLDRDGMHDILSNGNGVLIPISDYEDTASNYARALDSIICGSINLKLLKSNTINISSDLSWHKKIMQFESIYDSAIARYTNDFLR